MIKTHSSPRTVDADRARLRQAAKPRAFFVVLRWIVVAWFAAGILFAHGCHGPDEDHELFTNVIAWIAGK
jgi:hypothetical protein